MRHRKALMAAGAGLAATLAVGLGIASAENTHQPATRSFTSAELPSHVMRVPGHLGYKGGELGTTTPIKHLVVIFEENVSFDHYFATYPNARPFTGTSVACI